jgi:hypothetical protein
LQLDRQAFKWAFKLAAMPEVAEIPNEMDAKDMKLK